MTEIKFRVWFVESKKMYSWEDLINKIGLSESVFVETKLWKPMQYTGLKDKNGKEIWEGDICKETREHITNNKPSEDGWTSSILPIEFRYGMFCFGYHTNDLAYFVKCWGLKVIGNIHQNSELLEKPK